MTIGDYTRNNKIYDDEQCFEAWLEAGTLNLAAKILYDRGVRNRKGGMPSAESVANPANRWIVTNPEKARKRLIETGLTRYAEEDEWIAFIVPRAHRALSESQFFRFLKRYGYLEIAREKRLIPENYGKNRTI